MTVSDRFATVPLLALSALLAACSTPPEPVRVTMGPVLPFRAFVREPASFSAVLPDGRETQVTREAPVLAAAVKQEGHHYALYAGGRLVSQFPAKTPPASWRTPSGAVVSFGGQGSSWKTGDIDWDTTAPARATGSHGQLWQLTQHGRVFTFFNDHGFAVDRRGRVQAFQVENPEALRNVEETPRLQRLIMRRQRHANALVLEAGADLQRESPQPAVVYGDTIPAAPDTVGIKVLKTTPVRAWREGANRCDAVFAHQGRTVAVTVRGIPVMTFRVPDRRFAKLPTEVLQDSGEPGPEFHVRDPGGMMMIKDGDVQLLLYKGYGLAVGDDGSVKTVQVTNPGELRRLAAVRAPALVRYNRRVEELYPAKPGDRLDPRPAFVLQMVESPGKPVRP